MNVEVDLLARIERLGGSQYRAFLNAGYKPSYQRTPTHGTPWLLQKAIRRDGFNGRLFFVNIWVYDSTPYRAGPPVSYAPTVQFNTHGDHPSVNVELVGPFGGKEFTPQNVEEFFLKMYDLMDFEPYDSDEED